MPEACLVVVVGSETKRFPLTEDVCDIGRGDLNTIVLPDDLVSRRHAIVQREESGAYRLIDLRSRNGTFVNRQRVTTPVVLRPGDRITIGSHELLFSGAPVPPRMRSAPQPATVVGFAQQMITVLVADIRDFTGLSRRLPEAALSQLISAFTRESGLVLTARGACTQKYIGDAVMAFWIHQTDLPALNELQRVFQALAELFAIAGGLQARFDLDAPVQIGAGMNTGRASVGNMGSDASADFTALSDAVNLAFRLEAATKQVGCDLVLGRKTFGFLSRDIDLSDLFTPCTVELKGYEGPQQVYAAAVASVTKLLEEIEQQGERTSRRAAWSIDGGADP